MTTGPDTARGNRTEEKQICRSMPEAPTGMSGVGNPGRLGDEVPQNINAGEPRPYQDPPWRVTDRKQVAPLAKGPVF
jgi:hypothetical protein